MPAFAPTCFAFLKEAIKPGAAPERTALAEMKGIGAG
jgi:hypothetical protein